MFGLSPGTLGKIAAAVEGVVSKWIQASARAIERAWNLGRARAVFKESEWKEATTPQVASHTFTDEEKEEIAFLQQQGAERVRHLGEQIKAGVVGKALHEMGKTLTEASAKGLIRDRIASGRMKKETVDRIARDLRKTLGDYKRDWHRVVVTEVWAAKQRAYARMIADRMSIFEHGHGPDSWVQVVPGPNACNDCLRLYGPRESPRIFTLKELMETVNESTHHHDWKAVVPPLHPRCGCYLRYVPNSGKIVT